MRLVKYEKPLAIEHLVFQVKPERLDEWLELDHEMWTVAEAQLSSALLRKEVWLNGSVPGEVHCVIYWSDYDLWMSLDPHWLAENERAFAQRFGEEDFRLIRNDHEEGVQYYKISEFNSR